MDRRFHRNAIRIGVLAVGLGTLTAAGLGAPVADAPRRSPAAPTAFAKPATADGIRSAYEAGRWDEVLRAIPPALALTGKAAEEYDRHGLLRMRGEALLRTRATGQAVAAFRQAAAVAPDATSAATDHATALLVERSSAAGKYQPRRAGRDGRSRPSVDVLAPDARKSALAALFEDELAARERQIEAAATAEVRSFDGIDPLLPILRDLRALELAATDDDKVVADLTVGIDVRAARMLKASMEPVAASAEAVRVKATRWRQADGFFIAGQEFGRHTGGTFDLVNGGNQARAADKQVGLNTDTSGELRRVMTACRNVADRAAVCQEAFGGRQAEFEEVGRQAEETGAAAAALLGYDWRAVRVRLRPLTDGNKPATSAGG